jgi:creatinine amidohydrolase
MRFAELNWMDVENYLRHDDRIMVVLGATEQHGYLSLLTDSRIPMAFADAASQKTGVLIAPESNFGVVPYFMAYPGTISLRCETLLMLVEDLISALHHHGFRRILVLNGHGGNEIVREKLVEISNKFEDLRIIWYSWWLSNSVNALAMKHNLTPEHANWMEAFPFTRVADLPEGSKPPVSYVGVLNAIQARAIHGDGTMGGAYSVDDTVMNELFHVCLEDVLYFLTFPELPTA